METKKDKNKIIQQGELSYPYTHAYKYADI